MQMKRTSFLSRESWTPDHTRLSRETLSLAVWIGMDGYVAEEVAYVKPYPKLFNVEIMEVTDRYDDQIRFNCAVCYFLYPTLCSMSNM